MASHGSPHLRALYTVFVRPALRLQSPLASHHAPHLSRNTPHRPFSTTVPRLAIRSKSRPPSQKATRVQQPLRDADIPARRMQVVDPAANRLSDPQTKFSVMRSFDHATHRLVCVSKPPRYLTPEDPGYDEIAANYEFIVEQYNKQRARFGDAQKVAQEDEADGERDDSGLEIGAVHRAPAILVMPMRYIRLPTGEEWVPICRIENKAEASARAREAAQQKKEMRKIAPEGTKVVELNWAIDGNDLGHRLKKVEEFLRARRKVEVVIAPKRRGRKASGEECEVLLKRVRAALGNVEGAKEVRPMQGNVGELVSLMLEGHRGK
ncbi:hypothetical protein K461DRAFT_297883 [Myriangium duriaei CBS 260.36]|uniref:Translation initiation factor 3 N-terminal domain-containing protein n=1 Tax=Myriangium duriaei CBS 260.36 TaxID=1168546 RepID=A0A9P4MG08_9PEZI|nr:hypothetical protein K461DRAFT_297883 [Myriangium duriaei CBS 260.36]